MIRSAIVVGACLMLMFCSSSFGEEVTFLPTAPVSDEWIHCVYAKVNQDGLEISVWYEYRKGGRVLMYEDISLSIVDGKETRAVRIRETGLVPFAAMAGQAQAPFIVRVDAKEIRAVNVRVGELVVSLVPSVKTEAATAKSVPDEKAEDKKEK